MVGHSSSPSLVDYVYEHFVKGAAVQKGSNPGFGHALKLSYNTIDKSQLSVGPKSLNYCYKLSSDVPKFTVGLLTAIMDELSTNACFRVGLPCPPGVSLQMHTELVDHIDLSTIHETEMNVINIVTKLGKTVSHTRTEFRLVDTNQLIAYSSHVKYMPTGNTIFDMVMTNRTLYNLFERFYLRKIKLPYFDQKPLFKDVVQSHLEFHGLGRATFHITREHTNPFGALHGGCHAMIMETVAEPLAKTQLQTDQVHLHGLHIQFLSPAKGSIDVVCEIIHGTSTTLQVRVLLKRGDKVLSEGKLRFVPPNQSRL